MHANVASRLFAAWFVALGFLSPPSWAGGLDRCVPIRWEIEKLELLSGTPFNCLLIPVKSSAAWDGIVVEKGQKTGQGFRVPLAPREQLSRKTESEVLAVSDSVWPGIRALTEAGAAMATPSSEPWIDSNIWLVRSARAWAGGRPIWLGHKPKTATGNDYLRAIADAAIAGGRWIVTLDDGLRAGLDRKDPDALALWRRISTAVKFFEDHPEWRGYPAFGRLGIIQDSTGENLTVSGENLNLIARRQVPYRVIERTDLKEASLDGLQAVLATDLAPPADAERRLLAGFVSRGGTLITGRSWDPKAAPKEGFVTTSSGKGQVVIYSDDTPDPEALSKEMADFLGAENVGLRLFNAPSVLTYVAGDMSARLIVHLVNYSTEPAEGLLLRVRGEFRKATLYSPESGQGALTLTPKAAMSEVSIPKFLVNVTVVLEK